MQAKRANQSMVRHIHPTSPPASMIIAVGTDICAVERIERLLTSDKCAAFLERSFNPGEIDLERRGRALAQHVAGRWAAKEAIAKALGTGFGAECGWLDLHISRLDSGAPTLSLSGRALRSAQNLGISHWHLSISHEKDQALAFVVAERR